DGRSSQFCTDLMFWVMLSGILGSRLAYVLENWASYAADPLTIFRIDQGGLIFYGGFVASVVALVFFARRHRQPLAPLLDFVVTSVPLAHALGRIGCFFNGCCFGCWTQASVGVVFPRYSLPWHSQYLHKQIDANALACLPVHPVQLYEAAFNFAVYGLLVVLFRRRLPAGCLAAIYLVLYGIGRFTLEFFRGDRGERLAVGSLSIGQFVSLLIIFAGCAVFAVLLGRRQKSGGPHA
ncbi:MAG TPA: prolipoprotein diacylglyceryl transferase, partial [Verrucomicrobia bacterium]|nr:prolipoprotein diacylglyceryl transferase [Verrucomicrobiota bacterium]